MGALICSIVSSVNSLPSSPSTEHEFVVAVSDNRSENATADSCRRWQQEFAANGVEFRWSTSDRSLEVNESLRRAIQMSREPWTWTLGDDDELVPGVVPFICAALDRPDLGVLLLNHRGRAINDQHESVASYFSGAMETQGTDG